MNLKKKEISSTKLTAASAQHREGREKKNNCDFLSLRPERGGKKKFLPTDTVTQHHPPASHSHSVSSPCLTQSLLVITLPHTVTQCHPPASENHSQSSPCLTQSLSVIPLPHTVTRSHPPASQKYSASSRCLTQLLFYFAFFLKKIFFKKLTIFDFWKNF
jgi:hypothetical protein